MFELHHLTAQQQADWLRRKEISPLELVDHYLERIERLDGGLGAFTTVTADAARARARALTEPDSAVGGSAVGVISAAALWGLPLGDKDLVHRAGVPTGFGSRLMAGFVPDTSDELVVALDSAGAISLGKTNAPEFGFPAYTESLVAPPARTPWNTELGAGGSSGGAAVAVAAGLLPFAPGSDGGGSVRIPAAACGLVGLKPSRGLIPSGTGLTSLGGLVVPGPLARTVADAAMLLDAMIGDAMIGDTSAGGGRYPFAVRAPRWDGGALLNAAVRGEGRFQLGVMTTSPWDDAYEISISPEAMVALTVARTEFDALGHGVEDVALEPDPTYAPNFRVLWQAGAASLPAEGPQLELLEPLTRWLVERGRELSARQLAAALAALTVYERSIIRQLDRFDAVLTPSLALTPRPIGWYDSEDPERNFEQQVQYTPFTSFANVSGLPAITLPVAETVEGLPMGVQLVGRPGGEATLLALGTQLERRLRWQERHPPQW